MFLETGRRVEIIQIKESHIIFFKSKNTLKAFLFSRKIVETIEHKNNILNNRKINYPDSVSPRLIGLYRAFEMGRFQAIYLNRDSHR